MATNRKTTQNLTKPEAEKQLTTTAYKSQLALVPSLNAAVVIEAYQSNIVGKDVDINVMVDRLRETFVEVKNGDLHTLEAMLISQATALQTIFTNLARRAASQEHMPHSELFLGLALKAQTQSRATITALVDLKYPRQATFVKQANIANGPQQVNNAGAQAGSTQGSAQLNAQPHTHGKESESAQSKLLEADHGQPSGWMDTGAAQAAKRSYQTVETVATVHRPKKPRG